MYYRLCDDIALRSWLFVSAAGFSTGALSSFARVSSLPFCVRVTSESRYWMSLEVSTPPFFRK